NGQMIAFPHALSRARLLAEARVSNDVLRDLELVDPARVAVVEAPVEIDAGAPGVMRVLEDRPGLLRFAVNAPGRQLLALSESYPDGWRLAVNGQTAQPIAIYADYLGCVVPAGKSEVEFYFAPESLRYGWCVSLIGVAATLGLAGLAYFATKQL